MTMSLDVVMGAGTYLEQSAQPDQSDSLSSLPSSVSSMLAQSVARHDAHLPASESMTNHSQLGLLNFRPVLVAGIVDAVGDFD